MTERKPAVPTGICEASDAVVSRFRAKIKRGRGCHNWQAYRSKKGYGQFRIGGRVFGAHRIAYELKYGPHEPDLVIDHKCRNRACVNALHLRAVTCRENILSGEGLAAKAARQTHCKQGHPFSKGNTKVTGTTRRCLTCKRAAALRYYYRSRKDQ